ncbi:hypothetical protein [Achromobacter ruhlandii]|uniref:Uncharacterized protein n=1 Tax=Achromobacter ruhlandii TaxID=72557 RepID=A0ABM8M3M3_9BURK|nr:hypothetical protein [Achromobacter ruhlandii]MDC6090396.1 hypothetical protein [Achromobacter ruhlandii]WIW04130.1 hypothetical protein PPH40_005745 [Achromobacter ruhlandii]CAB3957293.1 hypothetical protein LMG7053_05245 [Achromobacter ruhlandii]
MTLLELIRQACQEMALSVPTAVVSSADPQTVQMFALLNRFGMDLCRQDDWQRLNREYIMTTVAQQQNATIVNGSPVITVASTSGMNTNWGIDGTGIAPFAQIVSVDSPTQVTMNMPAQASGTYLLNFAQVQYPLPSDWKKQIPQTEWDRTNRWPMMGPQTPQAWQSFKSGIVYAGPRERFRILGQTMAVNPPPPNGLTFAWEYISNAFVTSASGARKSSFTADDDTCVFDDSLMVQGLKVKFKQAKGLDVSFELSEFNVLLEQCKAQDRSAAKLNLSPADITVLLTTNNIQDGNWPAS